jgi:hypothetical protein
VVFILTVQQALLGLFYIRQGNGLILIVTFIHWSELSQFFQTAWPRTEFFNKVFSYCYDKISMFVVDILLVIFVI